MIIDMVLSALLLLLLLFLLLLVGLVGLVRNLLRRAHDTWFVVLIA